MKGEEGIWGALAPPPPRSQQNEKKSNKMEASPFRWISFFFLLRPVYFLFSFEIEPCLFSRKSRNMYFSLNQIRLSNGQAYKERIIYA